MERKRYKIRKGSRVKTSGLGRTKMWKKFKGTVTRRRGDSIYVDWDGVSFEDEMDIKEVNLLK